MQQATDFISTIKNLGYVAAFLLGLNIHSYAILGVFMFCDLFLGVLRAGMVNGWTSVKSYKFIAGIISKVVVFSVPVFVVWAGRGAGIDLLFLAQGTLAMLVLGEGYSILGNINSIRLRKDLPEFDAISSILSKVQGIFETLLSANREKL